MVILRNSGIYEMLRDMGNKKIILFGAGGSLADLLKQYQKLLSGRVIQILDNNRDNDGKSIIVGGDVVLISHPQRFTLGKEEMKNLYIVITSASYKDILKQVDGMELFDGLFCYIWNDPFICVHSRLQENEFGIEPDMGVKNEEILLPKIIHYCWFGEKEIPEKEKRCIASWKKFCPDYEFMFWNEDNYDINQAEYIRQAYAAGKYSFVSDYARLDVIYRYGGIYLDTDVELIKSIDFLLKYKAFFAFEYWKLINTGLGFGAVPHFKLIQELIEIYKNKKFINSDGSYNMKSCPEYHTEYFRRHGVKINDTTQLAGDILFLSSEYFCSFNQETALYELSDRSIGIHNYSCSWFENADYECWKKKKDGKFEWNRRLYEDYMKSIN
ncbi:MAG: hypothetical protein LUG83_04980 [Lachnospiraceae bacterium]|nr:hypothetical protein [Lachnospiraceae bacterium]